MFNSRNVSRSQLTSKKKVGDRKLPTYLIVLFLFFFNFLYFSMKKAKIAKNILGRATNCHRVYNFINFTSANVLWLHPCDLMEGKLSNLAFYENSPKMLSNSKCAPITKRFHNTGSLFC